MLQSPPADIDGYWIDRANHYLGYRIKHCGWNSDAVIRLFRRECQYETRWVHAEVDLPSSRLDTLKHPMLHYTTWESDQYLYKMNRYAGWGALNLRDAGRRPSLLAMVTRAPLRFLQLYVLRLGFLDGIPGFQICMHTAYYAFLKQAKLWELHNAVAQPDPEAERSTQFGEQPILTFPMEQKQAPRTRGCAKASPSGGIVFVMCPVSCATACNPCFGDENIINTARSNAIKSLGSKQCRVWSLIRFRSLRRVAHHHYATYRSLAEKRAHH